MTLTELILDKGLTPYEVAKEANVGASTISEASSGKRASIRLDTASKIAKVLNVTLEEINSCIGGCETDGIKKSDC